MNAEVESGTPSDGTHEMNRLSCKPLLHDLVAFSLADYTSAEILDVTIQMHIVKLARIYRRPDDKATADNLFP